MPRKDLRKAAIASGKAAARKQAAQFTPNWCILIDNAEMLYAELSKPEHRQDAQWIQGLLGFLDGMMICALISSVAVAFVGCINFIGLIAAHIMRRFVGNDFRFLIPCTALCGAVLLLASDIACRILVPPTVLPIGALTSFLGGPLFLWLIMRRRNIQ